MAGYAFGSNLPDGLTQKPAAHLCGRVLDGAIECEKNTMFYWTSQTKIEVFFPQVCGEDRRAVRVGFARVVRIKFDS
jgi:hypothetical protein